MNAGVKRLTRIVCWAAGVSVVVWAARSPLFRDAEGALTGAVCLPIASGFALVFVGVGVGTRYAQFACWTALALVGQAVTLQTIDAGRRLHYQHFETIGLLWATRPWLLIWIAGQTLIVSVALATRARALAAAMRGSIRGWQLAVVALLSLSTAATVSPSVSRYLSELAFAVFLQILGIATIVLVAQAFPAERLDDVRRGWDRVLGTPDAAPPSTPLRPRLGGLERGGRSSRWSPPA